MTLCRDAAASWVAVGCARTCRAVHRPGIQLLCFIWVSDHCYIVTSSLARTSRCFGIRTALVARVIICVLKKRRRVTGNDTVVRGGKQGQTTARCGKKRQTVTDDGTVWQKAANSDRQRHGVMHGDKGGTQQRSLWVNWFTLRCHFDRGGHGVMSIDGCRCAGRDEVSLQVPRRLVCTWSGCQTKWKGNVMRL